MVVLYSFFFLSVVIRQPQFVRYYLKKDTRTRGVRCTDVANSTTAAALCVDGRRARFFIPKRFTVSNAGRSETEKHVDHERPSVNF